MKRYILIIYCFLFFHNSHAEELNLRLFFIDIEEALVEKKIEDRCVSSILLQFKNILKYFDNFEPEEHKEEFELIQKEFFRVYNEKFSLKNSESMQVIIYLIKRFQKTIFEELKIVMEEIKFGNNVLVRYKELLTIIQALNISVLEYFKSCEKNPYIKLFRATVKNNIDIIVEALIFLLFLREIQINKKFRQLVSDTEIRISAMDRSGESHSLSRVALDSLE